MYKVLIADNEQVFVSGMEEVFLNLADFTITAISQNVDDLVESCQRLKPDLVLTRTFYFYKNTAFQEVAKLKRLCPDVKVLMMLDTQKLAHLEQAVDSGADACILRSASTLEYISAFKCVMSNQPVIIEVGGGNAWGPKRVSLNKLELEIVLQLCKNLSNEQIQANLQLDKKKLDECVAEMLAKTKHKNVLGLIFEAVHKGYEVSWRAEDCQN